MNFFVIVGTGAVVVLGGAIMMDRRKQKKADSTSGKKSSQALQEFLPLEKFHESGALVVNGLFRRITRIGDVNLYSMATEAIRGMRDRFKEMVKRLDQPFQISVQARRANYTDYVKYSEKVIQQNMKQYNNAEFSVYANHLMQYLKDEAQKPRTDRENLFIVSSLPKVGGEEEKLQLERLDREQGFVLTGLRSMGIPHSLLDSIGTVEAIQNFWNRERAISQRYRDAFEYQTHAPVVSGADVEVDDIERIKKQA